MKNILIMIVCLTLGACSVMKPYSFSYPNNKLDMYKSQSTLQKSIYIDEFTDNRSDNKNVRNIWSSIPFKYSIHEYWEKPESTYKKTTGIEKNVGLNTSYGYNLDIKEDLTKATIKSIKESKLFKKFKQLDQADYMLKAEILKFRYDSEVKLYGLSGLSSILHMLGFTASTDEANIKIKYYLIDLKQNKEVFSKTYSKSYKLVDRIYTNKHYEFLKSYEILYQEINNQLIFDLYKSLNDK